jgi:hypothetical protein
MPSPLFGLDALVREPAGSLVRKARRSQRQVRHFRQRDVADDQGRASGSNAARQRPATRRRPAR